MSEKRLYHTVARAILDMIESGSYPPGTRLPGERELAERFGAVSYTHLTLPTNREV